MLADSPPRRPRPLLRSPLVSICIAAAWSGAVCYALVVIGLTVAIQNVSARFTADPILFTVRSLAAAGGAATVGAFSLLCLASIASPLAWLVSRSMGGHGQLVIAGGFYSGVLVVLSLLPAASLFESPTAWEARNLAVIAITLGFAAQLTGILGRDLETRRRWLVETRRLGFTPRLSVRQMLVGTAWLAPVFAVIGSVSNHHVAMWGVAAVVAMPVACLAAARVAAAFPLAPEKSLRALRRFGRGVVTLNDAMRAILCVTGLWVWRRAQRIRTVFSQRST